MSTSEADSGSAAVESVFLTAAWKLSVMLQFLRSREGCGANASVESLL